MGPYWNQEQLGECYLWCKLPAKNLMVETVTLRDILDKELGQWAVEVRFPTSPCSQHVWHMYPCGHTSIDWIERRRWQSCRRGGKRVLECAQAQSSALCLRPLTGLSTIQARSPYQAQNTTAACCLRACTYAARQLVCSSAAEPCCELQSWGGARK